MSETNSVVCVRHPLARLASVYFQKMIDLGQTSWKRVGDSAIARFRKERDVVVDGKREYQFVGDDPQYARYAYYIN